MIEDEHPRVAEPDVAGAEVIEDEHPRVAERDVTGAEVIADEHPRVAVPEVAEQIVPATEIAETPMSGPRMLQPRVKTLWRIGFLFQAIVPSALAGVVSWLVWHDEMIWPVVLFAATPWIIAALLAVRLPARRYDAWSYRLTDDALRLDRGVMVRIESVVPYTRIQHVDTEQGPIERALRLTRVIVHTASGSGSTLTIPGLSPDDAAQLREQLALLAGVVEPL